MDELLSDAKKRQKQTAKKLEAREKPDSNQSHMKTIDPVVFNQWAEDEFIRITRELIGEATGKIRKAEILRECAYELKVSVETIKRYLFKHTARRAEFREFDGLVFLNPNYVNPNGVDDE